MKKYFKDYFAFLFSIALFLISFNSEAKPILKICITGSAQRILPDYAEAMLNGIKLARENYQNSHFDIEIDQYFFDETSLASVDIINAMNSNKCSAIIGFDNINSLIAAKNLIKEQNRLIVALFAEPTSSLSKLKKVIFIQPSSEYLVEKLKLYLNDKKIKFKKAAVIYTADDLGMLDYQKSYEKLLDQMAVGYDEYPILEKSYDSKQLEKFRKSNLLGYDVIILLARGTIAKIVSDYISESYETLNKKPPLYLSTEKLGSKQMPFFTTGLKYKNINIYFPRLSAVEDNSQEYIEFYQMYLKKFGKSPMVISGYSYDAANIILKSCSMLFQNPSNATQSNIIDAYLILKQIGKFEYEGITGVDVKNISEISHKKYFIINVTQHGYETLDR